jgi:threonine dehydratase
MGEFTKAAEAATREMRALFPETPLQENPHLSQHYGAQIFLKREDLSPVRSYKIRGAFNAMRKALAADPDHALFVCASAGNHAQGMAFACQHFGVHGVIFMPVTTPAQKIGKTKVFGGAFIEVVLTGDYFDETLAAAQAYARDNDARFLPPFDDADVIEGQASVAVELVAQMDGVPDVIVVPVGGGGLSSALVRFFDGQKDQPQFIFAEPDGGRSLYASLRSGELQTLPNVDNFVDGAAVARIGDSNFAILKDQPPEHCLGIPEDRLCATMLEMLNIEGIVLEPAGALTVDALKDLAPRIRGKRVVCITSGGNFDFERLPDVKERALRYEGLKKYFILRMPQRPGALRDFLNLLGPDDDIARFEYLKKSARNFGSVLLGIETKTPEGFPALMERMDNAGLTYQDITDDEVLSQFLI